MWCWAWGRAPRTCVGMAAWADGQQAPRFSSLNLKMTLLEAPNVELT